jgi:hypothetical protein
MVVMTNTKRHRDEERDVEVEAVAEGDRHVDDGQVGQAAEVDQAHDGRHGVADGDTDDDGAHAQVLIAAAVEDDGADEREAGALDAQQSRTDGADLADLDERRHAGHDERHADQVVRGGAVELEWRGQHQRRRHDPHEDGQQVL